MEQTLRKQIINWLLLGCFLIFLMVIVGGITRLTHSGLSIVEWNVVMGTLPPLNDADWTLEFQKYQQSPEYMELNYHFGVEDFKKIFWWEYLHRLLGRVIGLVFFFPFLYFVFVKKIEKKLQLKLLLILFMGGFQGFLGWFMVKSGLVNEPRVSHYRLALHLVTAFLTFCYTLWVALDLFYEDKRGSIPSLKIHAWGLFFLILLQIIYGAFVAGLRAGFVYNTFPMMGEQWIADGVTTLQPFWKNFTEGLAGVQFLHRYIAYAVAIYVVWIFVKGRKLASEYSQKLSLQLLLLLVCIQFLLGVFTLLSSVQIALAVSHQAFAFILLGASVFFLHRTIGEK